MRGPVVITGGIGSGKSLVCRQLAQLCRVPVIDLDAICRQLLEPGKAGWLALKENIDNCFFTQAGELDRVAFRTALFADNELRARVDSLIHPLARVEMEKQVSAADGQVLVEIPLYFEAGWQGDDHLVVVVYADASVCRQRIVARDHVPPEEAERAIAAQFPLEKKAELADHVIDNSGKWQDTCLSLQQLADTLGCS